MSTHPIPDALTEGAVRRLVVLAELASVTLLPFGPDDVALIDGLRELAGEVRGRLEGATV